ncbi:MAG: molybdenum cofactor biosynthesis protein MoaE [Chitinophagaceae bacterium]
MTPSILSHQEVADELALITSNPLDIVGLLARAHHPQAGAIVLFSGDVRNHSNEKSVAYLEYEAHESMASGMIAAIVEEAKSKWKLTIALATHRVGKVAVCESAVVVITASAHRHEAFVANRYIIDKIKHEVPIWKCEYFADGTKEWGGNCNCHTITGEVGKHVYEL